MSFIEKVGLQLYSVKEEAKCDFLGTLSAVAAMGYKYVEFAGFFDTPAEVLKETLEKHSLIPLASHTPFDMLKEDIENVIAYHQAVGLKYIICPYTNLQSREDVELTAKVLNNAAERANEAGLRLGYHNHDHEFVKLQDEYLLDMLLRLTEKSGVFSELDVFWSEYAKVDTEVYIQKLVSRCKILHLKDMKQKGEKKNAEVGSGVLDMKRIITTGLNTGVEYFIVEQESFDRPPLEACSISLQNLKDIAKQLEK